MKELDMRGKACPIPVVEARKVLEAGEAEAVTVLVDNQVAVQNLEKMARGKGYACRHTQLEPDLHAVTLEANGAREDTPPDAPLMKTEAHAHLPGKDGPTILIGSDHMGEGSDELGKMLLKGYLFTLGELPVLPEAVLFLNGGVKLACEGSGALADLRTLAERGVVLRVCGTCLNFYHLTDALAVGEVTDMMDISRRLAGAARLITL